MLRIESELPNASPSPTVSNTQSKEPSLKDAPQIDVDEENNIFIVSARSAPPSGVKLNGNVLGEQDYSVDEEGTIKLASEFVQELPDGEHVIRLEYGDEIFETIIIVDNGVPLSAGDFLLVEEDFWSVFNVICTLVAVVFACIYAARRKIKGDEKQNLRWVKYILCVLAALCIAALILTQNFTLKATFFDGYSVMFALLVIAQTIIYLIWRRYMRYN